MASKPHAKRVVRVGTRGSALAVTQTQWVISRLAELHPDHQFELVTIRTQGDRILNVTLNKLGDKGVFVKELEESLLAGETDLAIHSAKDLPGTVPPGLTLGAFPPSEDPRDVLVCREATGLAELGDGARIGTGSLRRTAQLRHINPTFEVIPIRGNIDTRLRRLESENLDAIVLAAAGLHRMGWADRISEYLDPTQLCVPAAAQGILAVECREYDAAALELLASLDDPRTRQRADAERAFLRRLEGGCQVPMGGYAFGDDDELHFVGIVVAFSGEPFLRVTRTAPASEAQALGRGVAEELLKQGAGELISAARAGGDGR